MAETIKGINVVIGAETTGLSKALGDVNKQSRDIQSELKQVEKLLKLDPTNTELVAQKQKLLSDAVATTKEKLDRLRATQEQVNEQFARGEISAGQYRAFQREIAATEQELRRLESRLEETQQAGNNLGESLQATGEKMKGAGEKMSLAITAPIAAAGGVMLKGAVDAETATGKLQAALGLTADEAADLSAVAEALWANGFGENIEEATKAIQQVRSNMGVLAEDELQAVAEGAMTIADVFEQDVNEVTKAAGVAMKNFGISGQEALDVITVGFQRGGDYSGELLDTIREYSPQFAALGLSADQAMGMLIAGAQAGAWNLDKVGDSMKEFNIRAQDGSKTTADGFAAIGLNAQQMGAAISRGGEDAQKAFMATITALASMDDPMQQNIAGVALFGTQWEDVRSQVIFALKDGVTGLGDFRGATEEAANAAYENNPGLALTMAMRELSAAIRPALLPLADIMKNTIVPAIKSMAEWFTNLSPAGQKTAIAIAGIVAAIGPLLFILGPIISAITGVVGAIGAISAAAAGGAVGFGILTTAFPVLGTVIAAITGPIGIAIAAIAALIAIGVAVYQNWDEIKEFFAGIWESIKNIFTSAINAIVEFFKNWGPLILAAITGPFGLIIYSVVKNWDSIKAKTTEIWNAIKDFVVAAFQWLYDHNYYIKELVDTIVNLWNTVKAKTEEIWNGLKSFIEGLWNGIKSVAIGIWQEIIAAIVVPVLLGIDKIISGWQNIFNKTKELWGEVKKAIQGVADSIWETLSGLASEAFNWGKNLLQQFIDGIKSKIAALKEIVSNAAGTVSNFLGFHSPTEDGPGQDSDKWAPNFIKMFSEGIMAGIPNIRDAVAAAADQLSGLNISVNGAYASSNALAGTNKTTSNQYIFGPGSVVIEAKDLKEMADVTEFFERLPQVSRSIGGGK